MSDVLGHVFHLVFEAMEQQLVQPMDKAANSRVGI